MPRSLKGRLLAYLLSGLLLMWFFTAQYVFQEAYEEKVFVFGDKIFWEMVEAFATPLLLALPAFTLIVLISVRYALKPLEQLGLDLAKRDARHLEKIDSLVPQELTPLVLHLNALLARLDHSLENERRFTSDAAHELRTPLAAIRAQVQVALGEKTPEQAHSALEKALKACDHSTHLLEQLLTLARLDRDAWIQKAQPVNLSTLCLNTIAEAIPMAEAKKIDIEWIGVESALGLGHGMLIGLLMRNLLDNAIRYSPEETLITVRLNADSSVWCLEVEDQGAGIPPEKRAEALGRFKRLSDTRIAGSGLGLSIVDQIARLHGHAVALNSGAGGLGLKVSVKIPMVGHEDKS